MIANGFFITLNEAWEKFKDKQINLYYTKLIIKA